MLNFLGQQVVSKPIEVPDVVKLKDARQQFRDLQRKSAIEQAKRDALQPDGTLDQTKLRSTLIEKGFGENADELVNAVTKERESAAAAESIALNRDYFDLLKGLLTPQEFNRRRSGITTVTANPVETTQSYDLTKDKDIPANSPEQASSRNYPDLPEVPEALRAKDDTNIPKENEILVKGSVSTSDGMKLQDIIPSQEYTTKTQEAQLTPDYLRSGVRAEDLLQKTGDGTVGGSTLSYTLPSDKKERELAIKTASTILGGNFDVNDPDVQSKINTLALQRAESVVPDYDVTDFKDLLEYRKYQKGRPAKVAEKFMEDVNKIEAGRSARIGQGLQERSTITGEKSQAVSQGNAEREAAQVSHPAIKGFLPNASEVANLTDASSAIKSMQEIIKNPPSPDSSEFQQFKLILGKDLIKAYNLPVGEGLLNEVSDMISNGASLSDAAKTLTNNGIKAGATKAILDIVSAYSGLKDIKGAQYLVRQATDFSRGKWGAYEKSSKFDEYFPEYKTNEDRLRDMSKKSKPEPISKPQPKKRSSEGM